MMRRRLPNRRVSKTFAFRWANMDFTATISRFADGTLAEVFLSNGKCDSTADTIARDSGVLASIALQHGAGIDVLRKALLRDARGVPSGPLGVVLDMISDGAVP
jgi:ribonucleoside-diphosphate reductase alpha chain